MSDTSERPVENRLWQAFRAPGAWLFALCVVLLPNFVFIVLSFLTYIDRTLALCLYLLAGILALRVPIWLTAALYLAILIYDLIIIISPIFMLHRSLLLHSLHYMVSFNLYASTTYLLIACGLIVSFGAALYLLNRYRNTLRGVSLLPAFLCVFVIVGANAMSGVRPLMSLTQNLGAPPAFGSAMKESKLISPSGLPARNILFVIVEGMGAFESPEHQNYLANRFEGKGLEKRYEILAGTAPYNGSTTSGEIRELCGRWGDYLDFLQGQSIDCLPQRLHENGFETTSFHAFFGAFFSRSEWYPKVGFETSYFANDLAKRYGEDDLPLCGITFEGLCDMAVADQLHAYLTDGSTKPRFTYWLTLNSHIPIAPDEGTDHFSCETGGPFGDRFICDMTEMWMDVLDRVAAIANDPNLPPTDIVLVGDHHPPLWTRNGRGKFQKDKVAWFALKAKAE